MSVRLAAVWLLLAAGWSGAHEPLTSRFTYNQQVFPILEKHCGTCHRPGGIGPMSLLRYGEAVPWAPSIREEVLEGRMPPWLAEEGFGEFQGVRGLSAGEIDILVDWAMGGAPEGAPVDLPGPAAGANSWRLGEPDLVLEPQAEVIVSADRMEETFCFVLPTGVKETRWVSALEFKPGNPAMVHGALVTVAASCSSGRGPLAAWVPGERPLVLPPGVGVELPAGSKLALAIHYRKTWRDDGKELRDRSRIGLYFNKASIPLRSVRVDRPTYRLEKNLRVLSVFPDTAAALPIQLEALLPDGRRIPMLRITRYDPAWRSKYVFKEPVVLPKGSILKLSSSAVWIDYIPS